MINTMLFMIYHIYQWLNSNPSYEKQLKQSTTKTEICLKFFRKYGFILKQIQPAPERSTGGHK